MEIDLVDMVKFDMTSFDLPKCTAFSLENDLGEMECSQDLPNPQPFVGSERSSPKNFVNFIRCYKAAVGKEIIASEPAKWKSSKEECIESAFRIAKLFSS